MLIPIKDWPTFHDFMHGRRWFGLRLTAIGWCLGLVGLSIAFLGFRIGVLVVFAGWLYVVSGIVSQTIQEISLKKQKPH